MKQNNNNSIIRIIKVIGYLLIIGLLVGFISLSFKYISENAQEQERKIQENKEIIEIKENKLGDFSGYAFLTENEKIAYFKIKQMINNFDSKVAVENVREAEIERILNAIQMDYPEYFWVGDFSYLANSFDNMITEVSVKYPYKLEQKKMRQEEIEREYEDFISKMPLDLDDYGKVKFVYEYVIKNTEYQEDPADDQNIYSVFGKKASVCAGYAKASQFLLNRLGIEASYVTGVAIEQGDHAWNLVCINGDYYYMDPTWGELETDDTTEPEKNITYDYFCVTTEELEKTHDIDQSMIDYPDFTSTNANYFIREKRNYDFNKTIDKYRFKSDIQKAFFNGEKYFNFRYTNKENVELVGGLISDVLGSFEWYENGNCLTKTVVLY